MSYILDALRKADAERERGHVPGIHAQPSFGGPAPTAVQAAATPWLRIGAGVLIAVLLAALVWSLLRDAPREVVAQAPLVAPVAAPPVVAAPPPVVVATPPPAPAAPARAQRPVGPKPVAAPPRAAAAVPTESASAPAAASPTAAANRVYAVSELPDDIRRQLPVVTVGGSMYSSAPASRILIVNGQVLHEGDRIAPELVLQQIKVKAAVLAFRGYRYEIAF